MSKQKFIAIRNQVESNTLELYYLDVIQDEYDWWTGSVYSQVQSLIDKVNSYKPKKIKVIIDSVGGDAQVGLSIYNFLKRSEIKIEVEIIGLAASIASVIAMAASPGKLTIARNAFMMIHRASGVVAGTAEDVRQGAEVIALYDSQIADVYSQRVGKPVAEITALMAGGDYWMTGEQAVAQGFADSTFNEVSPVVSVAARLKDETYNNIPDSIRAEMKPLPSNGPDTETQTFLQQLSLDMKKFFQDITNAIRGVKPADNAEPNAISNQFAEAVAAPFEKLGDEIESTINNRVSEVIANEETNTRITNLVATAVTNAMDLANPESTVNKLINSAVATATEPLTTKIEELETKNGELEKDITNKIGGALKVNDDETAVTPIGSFSK